MSLICSVGKVGLRLENGFTRGIGLGISAVVGGVEIIFG